jgi:hypothetical protein
MATAKESGVKPQRPTGRPAGELEAEGLREEDRGAEAAATGVTGDAAEGRDPSAEAASPSTRPGEALAEWFGMPGISIPALDATLGASEAVIKGGAALTHEIASFAAMRFRADLEAGRELVDSGADWPRLADCEVRYATSAMRDYLEEFAKLADLTVRTARDAWAPVQGLAGKPEGPLQG